MSNSPLIRTDQFIVDIATFAFVELSYGNSIEKESRDDTFEEFVIKDYNNSIVSSALSRYSQQEVRS